MPSALVLVHSPVLHPGVWDPVATELRPDHDVLVPSLTAALDGPAPYWRQQAALAAQAARDTARPPLLVGPRPEQIPFVERFDQTIPFYTHRHLLRPGVTGWAQVNFGYADNEIDTVEKLSYDLFYVKHVSPWLDISILGRSIWTVLSGFGAQ